MPGKKLSSRNPKGFSDSARYFLVGEVALCCELDADDGALAQAGRDYYFGPGYVQAKDRPLIITVRVGEGRFQRWREVSPGQRVSDPVKIQPNLFRVRLLGAKPIQIPQSTPDWLVHEKAQEIARDLVGAERKKRADAKKARAEQEQNSGK